MAKYLLTWNLGPGHQDSEEEFECETLEQAEHAAYEAWLQDAESQASYKAELIS